MNLSLKNIFLSIFFLLLGLSLFISTVVPFRLGVFQFSWFDYPYLTWLDYQRIGQILMLFFISIGLAFMPNIQSKFLEIIRNFSKPVKFFIVGFFSLGLISTLLSGSVLGFYQGFLFLSLYFMYFIVIIFTASILATYKNASKYLLMILIGFFIYYIGISIYNYIWFSSDIFSGKLTGGDVVYLKSNIIWPHFINVRFLNQVISWSLPLLILPMLIGNKNIYVKFITLLVASCVFAIAFGTGSRAFLLELLVIVVIISIFFRMSVITYLKWMIVGGVIGFLIYYSFFEVYLGVARTFTDGSSSALTSIDSSRLGLWSDVLTIFSNNVIFGIGPGHFPIVSYAVNGTGGSTPHQEYLLILSEWGIIAFSCLVGIFIFSFKKLFKTSQSNLNNTTTPIMIALVASLTAGFTHAAFSGVFTMPASQSVGIVICGVALYYGMVYKSKTYNKTDNTNINILNKDSQKKMGFIVLSILASSYILLLAIIAVPKLNKDMKIYATQWHYSIPPGYWSLGWITQDVFVKYENMNMNGKPYGMSDTEINAITNNVKQREENSKNKK